MVIILGRLTGRSIVKVGRIAGQFCKPRSSHYEVVGGERVKTYRGDMMNSFHDIHKRENDINLIEKAYGHALDASRFISSQNN